MLCLAKQSYSNILYYWTHIIKLQLQGGFSYEEERGKTAGTN